MYTPYTSPEFKKTAFNCPLCGAFSKMDWSQLCTSEYYSDASHIWRCLCSHCKESSYWQADSDRSDEESGHMVYPTTATVPLPHTDMPASVKADYEEARQICARSPRAAAALLRLGIQKLCRELGEPGENINSDIASLVQKGLPVEIQQALDIIRVVGNNAVHPGQFQPDDVADVASSLFELINQIVEETISKPAKLKALFERLPSGARDAIERRGRD